MPDDYLQPQEYRDRTGDRSVVGDLTIEAQITTACRALDRELGVAPGMFAPIASTTFTFSTIGGTRLYLRDSSGYGYFLRSIAADGLKLDTDGDGAYDDYLWDLADGWVRTIPENAAAFGEPYIALELVTTHPSLPVSRWSASLQITGTWGWDATPGALVELAVDLVHNLRQGVLAGSIGAPTVDGMPLSPSMWPVLQRLKSAYSRRIPAIA